MNKCGSMYTIHARTAKLHRARCDSAAVPIVSFSHELLKLRKGPAPSARGRSRSSVRIYGYIYLHVGAYPRTSDVVRAAEEFVEASIQEG